MIDLKMIRSDLTYINVRKASHTSVSKNLAVSFMHAGLCHLLSVCYLETSLIALDVPLIYAGIYNFMQLNKRIIKNVMINLNIHIHQFNGH